MKSAFSEPPILVIDRAGLIGESLSRKLSKEFLIVFVSRKSLGLEIKNQKKIIHVPFSGKFPVIPDHKYSHIIFIDEEGRNLELLPRIIEKVKNVNADFIFARGLSERKRYEDCNISKRCPGAKEVLFGDIFANELILRGENFRSTINKFIYQAQRFGKIQVLEEGLMDTYPVHVDDVVDGLIDLVFGMHKSHSLFYVFPKHPLTELSLAHMIQKANPEITIDFIRRNPRFGKVIYPPGGLNLLVEKYPLARKIRKIDIKKKVKARSDEVSGNDNKIKSFPLLAIWILTILLFAPFILTASFSFLGLGAFSYAKAEMNKGNLENAKSSLHLSQTFFYVGKQTSNILSIQAKAAKIENKFKNLMADIELGYKISQGLLQAFNSGTYFSGILNGKSENPTDDLVKGEGYLKSSIIALSSMMAEEKIPAPISQSLERINPLIRLLSNTVGITSNILGVDVPKTYLILFQDNMRLRPGGGLIHSYGILKLKAGKITEFSMHDVSDADKQLRGHVEPPFAIRRHLPEKHWYMKDSNFDVDFVKSASSASNFLLVETGQKADGTIAIDTSFVKSVLKAIGSVNVSDYKEIVNENNFIKLMQLYEGKNFSRSLYKTIITKITKEKVSYLLVAQTISDALSQKHLMFAFNDNFQSIFTVNGWSSSLWDKRIDDEESINDFMGISETNLGIGNTNYFIRRQVLQKVTIGDGGNISEELIINYRNDSIALPGAEYRNYLRVILPKNSQLSEMRVNDKSQVVIDAITNPLIYEAVGFRLPRGLEIEKTQEDGKEVFGFMVEVPAGEILKINIKYTLSGNVSDLSSFSYNLKLFKQPGVNSIPYSFTLLYPDYFDIVKSSGGIVKNKGKAVYSREIIEDKNLIIDFTKK